MDWSSTPALVFKAPLFRHWKVTLLRNPGYGQCYPLLPPEAGGGIRGMALFLSAQEGSPPAFRLQHPDGFASVLPLCGFDFR